jgi:nitroreductase
LFDAVSMAGGATVDSGAFDALEGRSSVRGYLGRPVPRQLVERILTAAARAPSGNNSQPWRVHVLTGSARAGLGDVMGGRGDEVVELARSNLLR